MKRSSLNNWIGSAIIVVGFTITGVTSFLIERNIEATTKSEFYLVCSEISGKISLRLSANALLLRSGAAFIGSSDSVTRLDWQNFNTLEKLDRNMPGIQGVGFSLIIPENQLEQHIKNIRKEGFPDYTVRPAGKREVYTSIIYLEPFTDRNLSAFGYDMFSEPIRRKAMEISRDSDLATLSGKVILVQETDKDVQAGTLMYVPVYKNGVPVNTAEQRREAIRGWVYSPYRMNDLMQGILGRWDSIHEERIHLQIYDDEQITKDNLLFDSQINDTLNHNDFSLTTLSLPVRFNGKEWILKFSRSKEEFSYFNSKVIIVIVSGILIVILLFSLFVLFVRANSKMLVAEKLSRDLKKSERQLKYWSGQFEAILDHLPALIYYKDKMNNFILVNKYIAEAHGKSKEELKGMNLRDLYPLEDALKYHQADLSVINSGLAELDIEEKWDAGGKLKWVSTSKIPYTDDSGEIVGIIGMSIDITDRKKAEEKLRETNSFLENLINYANAPIIVWDRQFRIIRFNNAFELITGLSEEEAKGQSPEILFPLNQTQRSMDLIRQTQTGNRWDSVEIEVLHRDGSIRTILWNSATLFEADGKTPTATIAQGYDITKRKKAEDMLFQTNLSLKSATIKANEMALRAESANKAKSIFLANMSHEIRTPLNAIIGFSQLLNREKSLTDTQREYNLSIIRSGEQLLSLINDILELSKVEAGRVVLNPENKDFHSFLHDIEVIYSEKAKSKHLQFCFETIGYIPHYVVFDEGKLRRIFVNLIENAIKFTDDGGIAVRIKVDKADDGNKILLVEVQDSGDGISESEQAGLFKHFAQASAGIKKGSGTGLGLVLSRELARLLGGDLTFTSELGKGSIFTFYIKFQEGASETFNTNTIKRVTGIEKKEKDYRILVVDDKEENLRVVVNLLKLVGFNTNEAVNGEEAIKIFSDWHPDLILMDLRMPVMDGYESTRQIKQTEKGKETPVIALTASAFEDGQTIINQSDFQGYIRKPFRENELFNTLGNILNVKYIYEEERPFLKAKSNIDDDAIAFEMALLPDTLVAKMFDALEVADMNQLIKLIKRIDHEHPQLAHHLMILVAGYEYDQLQKLLKRK